MVQIRSVRMVVRHFFVSMGMRVLRGSQWVPGSVNVVVVAVVVGVRMVVDQFRMPVQMPVRLHEQ